MIHVFFLSLLFSTPFSSLIMEKLGLALFNSSIIIFSVFKSALVTKSIGPFLETCNFSISPKSLIKIFRSFFACFYHYIKIGRYRIHKIKFFIYSKFLVSITILSSASIKGGTWIFKPLSKTAGLYEEETVCPFKASVVSILHII